MRSAPLASVAFATLLAATTATTRATVLLELAGGYLKDQGSANVTHGSGLLVLVASTSDSTFTPITSGSSLVVGEAVSAGSDDLVIYKSSIGGDGNLSGTADAGEFRQAINIALSGGLAEGNPIILYWFPTLTTSNTKVGGARRYGSYRSSIASSETSDADGSFPWVLPADGTSGYTLLFLTSDAGSTINTGTSGVQFGQTDSVTDGTNSAPDAEDDTVKLVAASTLDLLSNDSDADDDTLTITSVTQPAKGTAALSNGVVTYTPGASFDGSDTFTYTISDGQGGADTATVTIENPFILYRGGFSAIVSTGDSSVAMVSATLSATGFVTGKLVVNGKTYKLRGTAGSDGVFTQTIGKTGVTVSLTFTDNGSGYASMSGSVTTGSDTYDFGAAPAFATAPLGTAPAGRYNCIIPGGSDSEPNGTGWCSIVLGNTARLVGVGKLPDNASVSFGTRLRVDGSAVVSALVYGKPRGSWTGTLYFAESSTTDVIGDFTLRKPARLKTSGLFASGFTLTSSVRGERYVIPGTAVPLLAFTDSASPLAAVHFSEGGFADILTQSVSLGLNGKAQSVAPINFSLALKIGRGTGLVKGSFVRTGGKRAAFTGVTLQATNAAIGVFAGASQTGTMRLDPTN